MNLIAEYEEWEERVARVTDRIMTVSMEHGDYDAVEVMNLAQKAIHIYMLTRKAISWGIEKGLHEVDPAKQMNKVMEEVGELAAAINKKKVEDIEDAIGDIRIVLLTLCSQLKMDDEVCLEKAFENIKDRSGELIDGSFIKDDDL